MLPIEVHVPPQIAQVLTNQGQPVPPPGTGMALIDTGASLTCVREPILQQLQLNPIGVALFGTAHGQVQQSIYPARIVFPIWGGLAIDFQGVAGVDLTGQIIRTPPPQDVICLIGRNLLLRFVFV